MLTGLLPRSVAEAEGPAFWFLNNLCVVKATTVPISMIQTPTQIQVTNGFRWALRMGLPVS